MARARNVFVVFVALLCSATFAVGNDRSNSISFPTSDAENVFSSRKLLATGSRKSKRTKEAPTKSKQAHKKEASPLEEEVAKPQSKFQRAKAIKEKEKKMKKDGDKWDVGDVGDVGAKTQSKFQLAKAAKVKEKEEAKVEMEKTNAMREEIKQAFQAAQEKQARQAKVDAKLDREHQQQRAMHARSKQNAKLNAKAAADVKWVNSFG